MNIAAKILAGLGLLGIAFVAGWRAHRLPPPPPPVVQTVVKEKVVTKIVTVTAPDGTTTETTETTTDTTTTPPPVTPIATSVVRKQWSVGVQWQPDWKDRTWIPAQGEVGYRVLWDVWAVGAYNWKENAALLGVRYEW